MDRSKIVILVTGTTIEPYANNWRECATTWIPELRKLGYKVMVAIGNPDLESWYKIDGDFIYFKAADTKRGLLDKSIRMPAQWVLEQTEYEYYFRIDSDSFVEPHRFDRMVIDNLTAMPNLNYMGCCHPTDHLDLHIFEQFLICKYKHIASGCGYMVSRKAMKIALDTMRIDENVDYEIDDWVLGRSMWENGIELLHDSRILFESKYKELTYNPNNIPLPDISDPNSFLAIQHYMNGHMEEAMISLGYRN